MLRLAKEPRFTHAVAAAVPVDGGHREETFTATFRVIPYDEAEELARSDLDGFFSRILVECGDLEDEKGRPIVWDEEVRAQLLELRYVQLALVGAYFAGIGKARLGN